jgi:hypothetical protein
MDRTKAQRGEPVSAREIFIPEALRDRPYLVEWYRQSVAVIRAACAGIAYSPEHRCHLCGRVFANEKSLSLHGYRTHKRRLRGAA